jgi:hypothetical protein
VTDRHAEAERTSEEASAKKTLEELEENPPEKLEDWPDGKAKYETFGGAEGEEVDDPDEYKGDPIPGGRTDPATGGGPQERA